MLDPAGRVIMVSGASRGIGKAVLERLLARGYTVSIGLRDPKIGPFSDRLLKHRYDATDLASAEGWVGATAKRFGRIDGLVNSAGIATKARLLDPDETALDALWATNVKGPMRLVRLAWPHLVASGAGRVVNISSLSGKRVKNDNTGYGISKFALMALTQAIRREGWEHGIRASAVAPSFVDTEMAAGIGTFPREKMIAPADLAVLIETVLALPNTASIAELLVNCRHEDML